MQLYGLIGYQLTHSFSPDYFNEKFKKENIDALYKTFPIKKLSELYTIIDKNPDLQGLNVTIPYKESIIPYLDFIDEEAKKIHAVNTVVIKREHSQILLRGYNTDIYGFKHSILPFITQQKNRVALILGTGGTAKTVEYVLTTLDFEIYKATRSQSQKNQKILNYNDLSRELIQQTKLIVNTSPVGMYPHIEEKPAIPYEEIDSEHLLFDVVYNPSETLFLKEGEKRGALTKNGYEMLILQAQKAWDLWNAKNI
ncbi:MAG: shikimate dehydrogenase [Bacteroidales bacterium]